MRVGVKNKKAITETKKQFELVSVAMDAFIDLPIIVGKQYCAQINENVTR